MSNIAELPAKKQEYVRERIAGKSMVQAALSAGYAPSTANVAGLKVETSDVKRVFRDLVQRSLAPARLVERLSEGLDAVSTQFFQKDGVVMDKRDTIAWSERRAYLELAAEYAGYVEKDGAALTLQIGSLSLAMPEGDVMLPAQPTIDLAPVAATDSAEDSTPAPVE